MVSRGNSGTLGPPLMILQVLGSVTGWCCTLWSWKVREARRFEL